VKFFDAHGLRQDDAEEDVLAAFAKLEAYCARFALLFHLVKECSDPAGDPNNPITAETVEEAVALAEWFVYETERLYGLFGEGPDQREVRGLVELIRRHGGRITVRGLMLARRKTYPTAGVAEAALARLVAAGQAGWHEVPPGAAGGRPTRLCVLRDPPPAPDGGPDEPAEHTTSAAPEKPSEQEGCVCSVFCAPGPPSREPPGHEGEGQGGPSGGPGPQDTQHKTHTTPFPQGNEGGSGGCVREGGPPPLPPVPPGSPAERAEGPVDPPAPPNPQADREVGEL
jgi:hypothetical protein